MSELCVELSSSAPPIMEPSSIEDRQRLLEISLAKISKLRDPRVKSRPNLRKSLLVLHVIQKAQYDPLELLESSNIVGIRCADASFGSLPAPSPADTASKPVDYSVVSKFAHNYANDLETTSTEHNPYSASVIPKYPEPNPKAMPSSRTNPFLQFREPELDDDLDDDDDVFLDSPVIPRGGLVALPRVAPLVASVDRQRLPCESFNSTNPFLSSTKSSNPFVDEGPTTLTNDIRDPDQTDLHGDRLPMSDNRLHQASGPSVPPLDEDLLDPSRLCGPTSNGRRKRKMSPSRDSSSSEAVEEDSVFNGTLLLKELPSYIGCEDDDVSDDKENDGVKTAEHEATTAHDFATEYDPPFTLLQSLGNTCAKRVCVEINRRARASLGNSNEDDALASLGSVTASRINGLVSVFKAGFLEITGKMTTEGSTSNEAGDSGSSSVNTTVTVGSSHSISRSQYIRSSNRCAVLNSGDVVSVH